VLALATGNFGTIVRERTQIVVILLPLIAYGVSLRRPRIETVDPELEVLEPVAAGA
jgi:hypothetical protein